MREPPSYDLVQSIPEILCLILGLLPYKDRARAAILNKAWHSAVCMPSLWQHLDLSFASVGEVTDRALLGAVAKANGQLRCLDVSEQERITRPALLRALEGNTQVLELKVSKLSNGLLQLNDLTALAAAAPNLRTLHASLACRHGEAGQVLRREGAFAAVQLHTLSLGGEMTLEELQALIPAVLAVNSTVTTLDLQENDIGAEGARELGRALVANSTLTTLDLQENDIGAEGARELGRALAVNSTLTTLNLDYNGIGAEGVRELGRALVVNSTLTTLNLDGNDIGAEGARELGQALAVNKTLTTLDLALNLIRAEGAQELGQALAVNKTLTTLDLALNLIGADWRHTSRNGAMSCGLVVHIQYTGRFCFPVPDKCAECYQLPPSSASSPSPDATKASAPTVTRKAAPNATPVAKVVVGVTVVSALGGGCCTETDDARFARWCVSFDARGTVAYAPSDAFVKKVAASDALAALLETERAKQDKKAASKTDGRMTSTVRVPKLVDATWSGTARSGQCSLILTEGDSARSFAIAGLDALGRERYGVWPLKGKPINARECNAKQLADNEEMTHLKTILGLRAGEAHANGAGLRYGSVLVLTDADSDGSHIRGLVLNLLHAKWPALATSGFVKVLQTSFIDKNPWFCSSTVKDSSIRFTAASVARNDTMLLTGVSHFKKFKQ